MTRRDLPSALRAELQRHGRKGHIAHGGKHPRLVFWWRGRRYKLPFSSTPSCVFAGRKALADLKRILRTGRR